MATFDEQRALENVEKLREQILQARAERRRAEDAFEAFTGSFRTQQIRRESEAPLPPPSANAPAEIDEGDDAVRAAAELNAPETVPGPSRATVPTAHVWRPSGRALVVAGIALAGAAVFAVRGGRPSPEVPTPEATPAPTVSTPQTTVPPTVPIAKPPASSPAAASGVNVEVTTRRRVWMRVTLDGQRAFEREVPADQHIPLHADRSIVIRAGDAGAVAVKHNGREAGPLGRDGVIATREFTTAPIR